MKGKFSRSLDIDPVGKNRVSDDTIYTPAEKKKLKPNKACLAMYGKNNDDANEIVELLIGDYGRQLEHVPVSGHSFYDAFLVQISRDRNKYKNEQLMQQIAYYMVKWPNKFYTLVKPFLREQQSYESYVKNLFFGTQFVDYEVVTAVLTVMWNVSINIVFPGRGSVACYHQCQTPDIVIVCNNQVNPELYFCATRPQNERWRPIKGSDWSNEILNYINVKNAHREGEKKLRERLVNQVLQDFNDVTDAIENMKDKLSDCQDQIQKMMDKASDCSSSLTKLQAEQSVLRAKMIALGVDATKISKTGHVVPGVHFTQKIPTVAAKPQQSAVPLQQSEGVEQPAEQSSGVEQSVDLAESTLPPISKPEQSATVSIAPTTSTPSISTASTPAPTPGPSNPQALTPAVHQAMASGVGIVGGPQQIVTIQGQNVLISGSGPSTVGGLSIRYGKILKGTHKFFCKCKHPFTTRADLNRHLRENCPLTEKKQKHQCLEDECGKEFSSNQYLREHQHEVHFKTFLYFCRPCGRGFFKHCKLNHHKKNCLAYLSGPAPTTAAVTSTYTPSSAVQSQSVVTTSTTSTTDVQVLQTTAQVHQITLPIDTSEATGEVQIVGTTEGDPPVSYEFAEPKSINWNFPPDDDDEEHLPDVKL